MPVSRRSSHQLDAAAHSAPGFQPADTTGGAPQAEVPHQEGVAASSTPVPTSQIETVPGGQAMPSSASDAVGAGLPELPAMPASHDERPERLERAAGAVRRALSEGAEPSSKRRAIETLTSEAESHRHPLVRAVDQARQDMEKAVHFLEDFGSWDGRWSMPSRQDIETLRSYEMMFPTGATNEALTTAAQGKELVWSKLDDSLKEQFRLAAKDQWGKWIDNQAVEVLSPGESQAVITIVGLFVISSYNYKLSLKLGKVMSKVIFRQKLITL